MEIGKLQFVRQMEAIRVEGETILIFPDGAPMLRYNVSSPWDTMDGEWEAGPLYAGMSAALIAAVEPLSEVLARTTAEAEAATRKSSGYLR